MSSRGLEWVRTQHPLRESGRPDHEATLVLWWLAARLYQRDASHSFYAPQRQIANELNMALSTVGKKLKALERGGYITRHRRKFDSGPRKGQRTSDLYVVSLEKGPDDQLRTTGQPEALREANVRRSLEAAGHTGSKMTEEHRRDVWENELTDDWHDKSEFWEGPTQETGPLVLIDESSGEVVRNQGSFSNADRPGARRRPTEMWTQEDVWNEVIDRIRWVNPRNEVDLEILRRDWSRSRGSCRDFFPSDEMEIVAMLFEQEMFLNWISADTGQAADEMLKHFRHLYQADREPGGMKLPL